MGGIHLNKPVVGIQATPDNGGYNLVASDGGIFSFGNAVFYGSMGGASPQPTGRRDRLITARPTGCDATLLRQ